ncbi:flavin reductase family protein [Nocardia sp. NBC_01329]|uniref:flavin reductase family protein n=1 Tax=Nocardia sp. NBC_01329 TaxID=2903594 RepID=UPI002E0D6CEC|nr:flavin reductase family protein [Nocardia sp. NBC_01329]
MLANSESESYVLDDLAAAADAPVYLVTVAADDERSGCLVGFASQTGIDPARFLVCLSKANHTYRVAPRAEFMAVHLVSAKNTGLAELFGAETGDEIDKFDRCRWRPGPHGVPVLIDAVAWFSGRILTRYDFGDHVGFLLAPVDGEAPADAPAVLRFHHVAAMRPGHPA